MTRLDSQMSPNRAALAFWDHVDHQFGFIGHWSEWYFDFSKYANFPAATPTLMSAAALAATTPASGVISEKSALQSSWGNLYVCHDSFKCVT